MSILHEDDPTATGLAMLERLPDEIREVCSAAGNPLEIAASLEARGISSRVAQDRFGLNVFELAEALFSGVAAEQVHQKTERMVHRPGRPQDLLRGAMFVAPAVMFTAVVKGLHLHLPSWTFLLALTSGWACGQTIAAVGSAFAGRNQKLDSFALWGLVITAGLTAGFAEIANELRNGGLRSMGMAVIVAVYVVACSILLMKEDVGAMARPLVPATVLALMSLLKWPVAIPIDLVLGVTAVAIGITVGCAARGLPRRWWHVPRFIRTDFVVGARYFGNGLFCGLATSLIAVLSSRSFGESSVIPVASYPVLFTLGVMEWQLRTFRARAHTALRKTNMTGQFGDLVWRAFLISLSIYLVAMVAVSLAVAESLTRQHTQVPTALLIAEICLGCTFFTGLVASTCFRIDIVLRAATVSLVMYVGLFAYERLATGHFDQQVADVSCCIALATALLVLIAGSRAAIRSAFSYQ